VAEVEWKAGDAKDLISRDRRQAFRQGLPFVVASGLLAFWLRITERGLAAVLLGMCLAWLLSVAFQIYWAPSRWRAFSAALTGPMRVTLDDSGITWLAPHGSRHLYWGALGVSRIGDTWVLSVRGQEAAFVPARCLNADESSVLQSRAGMPGSQRAGKP
jgi:hypothetical protein